MPNPFASLIDLKVEDRTEGKSTLSISVGPQHMNPHGVVHGAVLYALADTGMGAALYSTLEPGQICATIEIKINYFKPVTQGTVHCESAVLNRGKTVANMEARLYVEQSLVGVANGNFAIFRPKSA